MTSPLDWRLITYLLSLVVLTFPARAQHFTTRQVTVEGIERGMVVSHGVDLFEIATSAGGLSAIRRAEIVAARLEELAARNDFFQAQLSVGVRNGEVIIQQQENEEILPRVILTVDRQLAKDFPGAEGNVERIARWWLALLRDHLALARGTEPFFTKGTPVGKAFQKIYNELDRPAEPVSAGAIERALQTLSEEERRLFKNGARSLPAPYRVEPAKPQQEETTQPLKEEPPPGEPKPGQQPPLNRNAPAQASGKYLFILNTDPRQIEIGKKTTISVQIMDDHWQAVSGAVVRAWLTNQENAEQIYALLGTFDPQVNAYRFPVTVQSAGEYLFTISMVTEDQKVHRVEFTFIIRQSERDRSYFAY